MSAMLILSLNMCYVVLQGVCFAVCEAVVLENKPSKTCI